MVGRGTDGFLGQPGAQGRGNFGVVLGAGCFVLPPVQEGFQPINGPWRTPQMGLMQAGKEGCRLETSQEDTSPPRPPPLRPQERKPKHTWDWCARTQPIPGQPGASSPPALVCIMIRGLMALKYLPAMGRSLSTRSQTPLRWKHHWKHLSWQVRQPSPAKRTVLPTAAQPLRLTGKLDVKLVFRL